MTTTIDIDNLSSMIQDVGIEAFMIVARLDAIFQPVPMNSRTLQFYDKVEVFTSILNFHLAPNAFVVKDVEMILNLIECNRSLVERLLNLPSLNDIIRKFKEQGKMTTQQVMMVNPKVLMPFTNYRIVTKESLNHSDCVHFSGDLAYSKTILHWRSSLLIDDDSTFTGFCRSIIHTLYELYPSSANFSTPNALSQRFEVVYILWELARFELMLGKEEHVLLPLSLSPASRASFLEGFLDYYYSLFVLFWSRHQYISNTKCDKQICSKVALCDGHQKRGRIVCAYTDIVDTSIIETGPINVGCPYAPMRRRHPMQKQQDINTKYKTKNHSELYCPIHQSFANVARPQKETELNKVAHELDQNDHNFLEENTQCNVYRDDLQDIHKNKGYGVLVTFLSRQIVIGFDESIRAEGMRRITRHFLRMLQRKAAIPNDLVYDSACTLRLHWQRNIGTTFLKRSEFTDKLVNMTVVIDRFHMKNHKRQMCQGEMKTDHPIHNGKFLGINTELCEQYFNYLSRLKASLRTFNFPASSIFLLLFHLRNCSKSGISASSIGIAKSFIAVDMFPIRQRMNSMNQNENIQEQDAQDVWGVSKDYI
ncbi:unnamed protein product [Rotaria magnacalcarata]|uniref:Uncharacterized protein n=1 Tax=Rotaria magnacalcarata TaxID=392030 RepID=A0A815ZGX2_9BILA|nr:unnamed protein product [Rotaria magnacalcarata]CAF1591295.1 unnamed protein product [Rotaria magnacalcarata]CAF3780057.1 unnamed protein product [Rotaria magnacalcarata]CAF3807326.1 unnamed protein product [Rotaria magnacalcarata]CAF3845174.1 unnamed protein product [Rotaria magnacalcarata]